METITFSWNWISVNDALPKESNKRVLTVGKCDDEIDYQTARYCFGIDNPGTQWEKSYAYWDIDGEHCPCCDGPKICYKYEVTHWMEIPKFNEKL